MSDIVERLRNPMHVTNAVSGNGACGSSPVLTWHEETVRADMLEAAAEILRLRATIADLRQIAGVASLEGMSFDQIKESRR